MHTLRLIVTAAALVLAVGCSWMKDHWGGDSGPPRNRTGEKLPDVAPNRLVKYLNDRAAQFHSVDYGNIRLNCSQKGVPLPAELIGNLVCVQPRNFRMVGQGKMVAAKV